MVRGPLRKREVAVYYLLYRMFGSRCTNLGELLDVVRLVTGSRRLADAMVRRLARMGLMKRCGSLEYALVKPDVFMSNISLYYLLGRLRRIGVIVDYSVADGSGVVEVVVDSCGDTRTSDIARLIDALGLKPLVRCAGGSAGHSSSSS